MYTRFYGFSEKPFHVTPDPKFLFLTESHQKALDAILYGVGERKGFISISGEAGTGKTTILHHLLQALRGNVKTVFINQTQVTPKQLLKEIVQKIGLTPKDQSKMSLIRQLNEYLISALAEDGNLAILIDEAQNLNLEVMEELRMLSNLETRSSKLIQIAFVGQPELEEKLNSKELRQLKQRIAIRSQIRRLMVDESRDYVGHRLTIVGSSLEEIFHPEAVNLICRYAEGIPRTINLLCDNALLIGFRRREKRIPAATVKEVLSDRGIAAEENVKKARPFDISLSRFTGDREKKFYTKSIYFALPAALAVILIFLAGAKPMTRIAAWFNLAFVRTEAVAKPEGGGAPAADSSTASNPPAPRGETGETASPSPDASKETRSPGTPVIEEKPAGKTASLENGETLYSLLRRSYNRANATLLDYILEVNPEIVDPNLVLPNERIRLPILAEESLIRQSPNGSFRIHLATFAKKEFAERYKSEETLKGRVIRIEDRRVSSQEVWYRVFADGYHSREDGRRAVKILRGKRLLPIFAGEP
jgi:general secretion pathway protein A